MKFIQETLSEFISLTKLQMQLGQLLPSVTIRKDILKRFSLISKNVQCPHNESHLLSFVVDLLSIPKDSEGCIVEAGAFKGGSTSKLSIIAKFLDRKLIIFDSFEGLPANKELHDQSILGHSIEGWFEEKQFSGSLEEVKSNITKYGEIEVCQFVKGWFSDTMPNFSQKIFAAYVDVDLAASTKTCLKYLYPLIVPKGILCSQDGDFPLVIDVFDDDVFWEKEVGCAKPHIEGIRKAKILRIAKP